MLTWGLLVIIVNIAYLLLSMLIGYLAYKFFEHKYNHIGKIVFIVVLLAPFWDLIIQKGVKTYYQAFMMEAKIYAYPELDEDGKIESLDLTSSFSNSLLIGQFVRYLDFDRKEQVFSNISINKFKIDSFIKRTDFDDRINKNIRILFNDERKQVEFIKNNNARYKMVGEGKSYLFSLYTVNKYLLIDNKIKKTLVKDMSVNFKRGTNNKFRNKILLWKSSNNSPYGLGSVRDSGLIKQVLKINYL
jgi:hypothetical protein